MKAGALLLTGAVEDWAPLEVRAPASGLERSWHAQSQAAAGLGHALLYSISWTTHNV